MTMGPDDVRRVAACLLACGFDADAYVAQHPDLTAAGLDGASGLQHFIAYGCAEGREPIVGPLPDGLHALRSLADGGAAWPRAFFRAVFRRQALDGGAMGRLWLGPDPTTLADIQAMSGLPYYVFGDSHAAHYAQGATVGAAWLAGIPIVCHGASAAGLARIYPPAQYGAPILRWLTAAATAAPDVPVFLKFGGIDAEFRWMAHRLENGVATFSVPQFDDYAAQAVAQYARFLDAAIERAGRKRLRICTAFPTALFDACWIEGFLTANGGTLWKSSANPRFCTAWKSPTSAPAPHCAVGTTTVCGAAAPSGGWNLSMTSHRS